MSLVDLSFVVFFIAGGLLIFWYLIVGIILTCATPEEIKQYAYTRKHYTEVELALVSGCHCVSSTWSKKRTERCTQHKSSMAD